MKVWILKEDGTFNFEYDVPKGVDGDDLIPSVPYAETSPPILSNNKVALYDNGEWKIKDDFRGVQYWIGNESFLINEIGEDIPEGATLTPPPSKQDLLSSITVTTQSGNTFDGNETARNNMLSAIMAADIIGQTESQWKLANNTVETVTIAELKEALTLSIQRVGEIVLSN